MLYLYLGKIAKEYSFENLPDIKCLIELLLIYIIYEFSFHCFVGV